MCCWSGRQRKVSQTNSATKPRTAVPLLRGVVPAAGGLGQGWASERRAGEERRGLGLPAAGRGVHGSAGNGVSVGSSSGNVSANGRESISYRKDIARACWLSRRLEHTHRLYRRKQWGCRSWMHIHGLQENGTDDLSSREWPCGHSRGRWRWDEQGK